MTPTLYSHVRAAVAGVPWLIHPPVMDVVLEVLARRIEGVRLSEEDIAARIDAAEQRAGPRRGGGRHGAIAVIPVYGVLAHRAEFFAETSSQGTSVQSLQRSFREAMADPDVAGVLLDVDSPGGQVSGIPEFAAEIRGRRGEKPIVAIANTFMASAAYYLGAQADEVVVAPSSYTGSVGVVMAHEDWTAADEQMGIKTTLVYAGEFKVETYPQVTLTDGAREYMQRIVDESYRGFIDAVAKGRGVTAKAVQDDYGKGRVLSAKNAVAIGMADRVDTFENTIARLAQGKVRSRAGTEALAALAHLPAAERATAEAELLVEGKVSINDVRAAEGLEPALVAGAIGRHETGTTDEPWDGPANDARCPAERGPLRASHAWVDDDGDPDAKVSYKFGHHHISEDGQVGAANVNACSNGRAVLKGGRGGTSIPDEDKPGVWDHLASHERDAGRDVPDYATSPISPAAELDARRRRARRIRR